MSTTVYVLVQVIQGHRFNAEAHCLREEATKRANHFNADPRNNRYEVEELELHEVDALGKE